MKPNGGDKPGITLEGGSELLTALSAVQFTDEYMEGEFHDVLGPLAESLTAQSELMAAVEPTVGALVSKHEFVFHGSTARNIELSLTTVAQRHPDELQAAQAQQMLNELNEG